MMVSAWVLLVATPMTSRRSILESVVISVGATAITMFVAVLAAYALSRMNFKGRNSYLNWVLGQRFMPPIAVLVPLVVMFKMAGMRDTDNYYLGLVGLMLIYSRDQPAHRAAADEIILRRCAEGC